MTNGKLRTEIKKFSGPLTINAKYFTEHKNEVELLLDGDYVRRSDVEDIIDKAKKDLLNHMLTMPKNGNLHDYFKYEVELETKIFEWFGSLKPSSNDSTSRADAEGQ